MLKIRLNPQLSYDLLFRRTNTSKFQFMLRLFAIPFAILFISATAIAQYYGPYQNTGQKSSFRQEIARVDITVDRTGYAPLPIKLVPRVQKDDIIRVRMLNQPINGIAPDKSLWNWTFVVAFVNPSRNETSKDSVSREVNFRREGWYREHVFKVPFDSQPIFFLYPRPNYRNKIRKLITRNFDDVRKIGEKTLEIAGAYAKIGMFLNQLQDVIRRNPEVYGGYNNAPSYGGYYGNGNLPQNDFMREQFVERLAQSFNIALPSCWKNNTFSGANRNYGYNPGNQYAGSTDFVSRAQCVAQNVRLEDFDLSVSKILSQGGLLAATRLAKKFPELAHWINIAAVAADLILRITRKTPLKILPTMVFSGSSNPSGYNANGYRQNNYNRNGYVQNYPNASTVLNKEAVIPSQPISIFADKSPTDSSYVSAFPIVLHKWQPQPDPEVITLPIPTFLEPCIHVGRNIIKNTDLSYDWLRDPFARDFRLVISSANGFTKELPLVKNIGMSGWDIILTPADIATFPKVKMTLEAQVIATRGFSKIRSRKFEIPIPGGGNWTIAADSKSSFSVGGKRRVAIENINGTSNCIRTVVYKPSFGGEFVFAVRANANPVRISKDGKSAWFNIDTTEFKSGKGNLEIYAYGSARPQTVPINLYGLPPEIAKLAIHKGDKHILIEGKRTDQILSITVNGKLAPHNEDLQIYHTRGTKIFVFKNPHDLVLSKSVSIEMELEGGRKYKHREDFTVLPARPTIAVDEEGTITADILGGDAAKHGNLNGFDLSSYPITPVGIEQMTVAVRTSLTDYGFRAENISIETRIENGLVGRKELPKTRFEVIDEFNMRIGFDFNEKYQQFLAGRRLQFRIRDRVRGVSDWYTIKQTFIRTPKVNSVNCGKNECRITGKGLDYIGNYSTDGGKTWNPPLHASANPQGKFTLIVPGIKERKLLRIKLRDFPKTEGFRP